MRKLLKAGLERLLRPYGYRLVNPSHRYGIDAVADVARLSRLWKVDVTTIFDVGANVGRSALSFRSAWPDADIFAFEPDGSTARTLRANSRSVRNLFVEELALAAESGSADFFVHRDSPDLNSLSPASPYTDRFGLHGEAVVVQVTTVDQFCAARNIGSINLLKIDTEGSDYDVLRGSSRLLRENRIDFIYCEFNSCDGNMDRQGSLIPIASLLGRHGYHFIASYNDYITTEGPFFSVSNALFAADRGARVENTRFQRPLN